MGQRDVPAADRVLVLAPTPAEADLVLPVIEGAGIACYVCVALPEIAREFREQGAAAVVLTEDHIAAADLQPLIEALRYQAPWSDLPILLLTRTGAESPIAARWIALLGNVAVLDRDVRPATLVSAARTALRARERQYTLRDQVEALRRSEERFELAAQATQNVIWEITRAHGREQEIERRVYGSGIVAHGPGFAVWKALIHPADRQRIVASLRTALDGDASLWSEEYRFRAPAGEYVHVVDRGQILRAEDGRAVRAVGAMMDVSERKRVEETIALHAAIIASSDDAIVSKTLDGTIRSWNASAERLFGYTAEEAVGQPISLIIPKDKLDEEMEILRRLGRGERIDHFETVRVAKDGRKLDISLTVSPLFDANERVFGASKVARDITARKRTENELVRRDVRLNLLWESAAVLLTTDRPDAMLRGVFEKIAPSLRLDAYLCFMFDESGEGKLCLESWSGIDERDAEELDRAAEPVCEAAARERRAISMSRIQTSTDEASAKLRELGFEACAANPLIVEDRVLGTLAFATRSKDALHADEIEFIETVCRYVTVAYERMHLIRRLRETDNRKDEFLAMLAHELRNPLAPIRNALEIMRVDGHAGSVVGQAARVMMERQLEQMVRLIDDLLDVSRITRGRLELRKERVALDAVIRGAIDTSRPLIEKARHELTVELPAERVVLDADPVRLAQVFSNLLNNAARYMDEGGHIWIRAECADGEVRVSVRDTGVGIPADALPWIFDMFVQAGVPERSQSGLGIGLTLVKRLVDMHGGSVEATSDGPGRGAEFTVRLPVAPPAPAASPVEPAEAAPHSIPRRVLIADDNRDAADSMAMLLRLMGNEVRTVHDGIAAVEEAAAFRPSVILLDIGMPRLNGYDAARLIRQQRWSAGTLLVALTGWGQEEDKRRAADAGFDRHFTKPLDPGELRRLITDHTPR